MHILSSLYHDPALCCVTSQHNQIQITADRMRSALFLTEISDMLQRVRRKSSQTARLVLTPAAGH